MFASLTRTMPKKKLDQVNLFGEGVEFEHIGMVVECLEKAAGEAEHYYDPIQKVKVAFVDLHGVEVEYIEPTAPDSPVAASLKAGRKLVHLCLSTPDIEQSIDVGKRHAFACIGKPVPAVAFDSRRIAWMFSRTYGLIELLER